MIRVAAYLPDGRPGPGRLSEVALEATVTGSAELVLPEVTVRDERGGDLLSGPDLVFDPAAGGGPLVRPEADRQARAFGITNTAYHVQRAMRLAACLLDRPLPHLLVRIGTHASTTTCWGGGHYRLPGTASPAEAYEMDPTGEVHLGGGRAFIGGVDARYFHCPAHNAAIVYHEVGHHICRHTADFRANRLRDPYDQHNGKVALDEGTADFLTAVLLGTPDIYGWHRAHIAPHDQRRRRLDVRWTMAVLRPRGSGSTHADGTIWSSALWSARECVLADGGDSACFTSMLLRGLARLDSVDGPVEEELNRRRLFCELLRELTAAAPSLAPQVLDAMASHGIHPEGSNDELRDRCRDTSAPEAVR